MTAQTARPADAARIVTPPEPTPVDVAAVSWQLSLERMARDIRPTRAQLEREARARAAEIMDIATRAVRAPRAVRL